MIGATGRLTSDCVGQQYLPFTWTKSSATVRSVPSPVNVICWTLTLPSEAGRRELHVGDDVLEAEVHPLGLQREVQRGEDDVADARHAVEDVAAYISSMSSVS